MNQHPSDILVSDVEPAQFVHDNWPNTNANAAWAPAKITSGPYSGNTPANQPTLAQLQSIAGTTAMNGAVFSVALNNGTQGTAAVPGAPTSLSLNSIRAIYAGRYATWRAVPEVGSADAAGTPIFLCRRDHGSGTELSTDIVFEGFACGVPSAVKIVTPLNKGLLANVQENVTTTDMKTCVEKNAAAIGILGLSPSAAYTTVLIDGAQANAHNAASGIYPYATENVAFNNSGNSGSGAVVQAIAAGLITDGQKQATLATFIGETVTQNNAATANEVQGFYTSAAPQGNYALQGLQGNKATQANAYTTANQTPVAAFNRSGASCAAKLNSNL
jgi:hypothetical protein